MALRVVSGREEAMATCVPINALISVDLPTFGRPTTATNPDLYTVWSCVCWAASFTGSLLLVLCFVLFGLRVRFPIIVMLGVRRLHHYRRDLLPTAR